MRDVKHPIPPSKKIHASVGDSYNFVPQNQNLSLAVGRLFDESCPTTTRDVYVIVGEKASVKANDYLAFTNGLRRLLTRHGATVQGDGHHQQGESFHHGHFFSFLLVGTRTRLQRRRRYTGWRRWSYGRQGIILDWK